MHILSATILIVDDNQLNRLFIKKIAQDMGISTEEAANGKLALELMNIEKFDLVLLDIKMEGMNGIEVLKAIRSDDKLKSIPVMMMSAVDDLHTIKECLNMGAVDYIPKPFDINLVQSRIYRALKHRLNSPDMDFHKGADCVARIMVIDDESLNLDLIDHCLADTGCEISLMKDPIEALAVLENEKFDLVLLDIKMQAMDGMKVLNTIKNNEHMKDIPVLMLSALDDFKTIKKCMEQGAIDYIAKPFEKVFLLTRIQSCLGPS
jgi:CheY-like chemotaxis protein